MALANSVTYNNRDPYHNRPQHWRVPASTSTSIKVPTALAICEHKSGSAQNTGDGRSNHRRHDRNHCKMIIGAGVDV